MYDIFYGILDGILYNCAEGVLTVLRHNLGGSFFVKQKENIYIVDA